TPDSRDVCGIALHHAIDMNQQRLALDLIEYPGCDLTLQHRLKNHEESIPLILAAKRNRREVTEKLLKCDGVDVNATDSSGGTALHAAARYGSLAAMTVLLEDARLVKDARDKRGLTAIGTAFLYEQIDAMQRMHANGILIDLLDIARAGSR
ncbi:hypothetical protein G3M48_003542, partial [Beauveria asiatica]